MKHLIKIAGVLLALVASYFVKEFTSMVAPEPIAWLSACSLVGTYIGLAYAEIPHEQKNNAKYVAFAAMCIEAVYGTLYVFSQQTPLAFAAPMEWYYSLPLAALHGAPFTILLFLVSVFVTHREAPQATEREQPRNDTDMALLAILEHLDRLAAKVDNATQVQVVIPAEHRLTDNAPTIAARVGKAAIIRQHKSSGKTATIREHKSRGLSVAQIADTTGWDKKTIAPIYSRV